ncbi:Multiple stress resistance protein BhsA [Salmonella enterica subsp. enterica serovar Berta str. ATCC 8392]|nr:Multiple stress resistance protein BhsA [Salmonella enterica subsp. enterica serovar Berta str. ATCC 8392]
MKNVKNLIAAAVLSSLSFASFAAVEVQATPEGQQKFGTISANGGTNLGSLEDQLAQKSAGDGGEVFPYYLCYRPEYPSRYGGNL